MQILYNQLINYLVANGEKIYVCCQPLSAGDAHRICILHNVKLKKVWKDVNYIEPSDGYEKILIFIQIIGEFCVTSVIVP